MYHNGRWEDKAIFLQRELNDIEAERGLYERRLAVTAANIGLMNNAKVSVAVPAKVSVAVPAHRGVAVPATSVTLPATTNTFGWFNGPYSTAVTTTATPWAGTAVPIAAAMPFTVSAAPSAAAVTSVEEPLDQAAVGQVQAQEMSAQPPMATAVAPHMRAQASMLAAYSARRAAGQGMQQQQQGLEQQQLLSQQRRQQQVYGAGASASTQELVLQPGTSYSINV